MALTQERQEEDTKKIRPKASQIIEGVGIAGALGTLALGLLGTLPEHPEFDIGREVFGNIPDSLQVTFYVTVAVFIWLTAHLFALRAASWQQGKPEANFYAAQWKNCCVTNASAS